MQKQRTQKHGEHGGKCQDSAPAARFSPWSLCLLVLCGIFASNGGARAATVQTVDDATIRNATIAFDGQVLSITTTTQPTATTMPVEDVARIVYREPVPAPANDSGTEAPKPAVTRVRRTKKHPPSTSPAPTKLPAAVLPDNQDWRMKLSNGDVIRGVLDSWADGRVVARPAIAPDAQVQIDAGLLESLWHGEAADEAKAQAMQVTRGDQDTVFVRKEKDGDIIALQGSAKGIDGGELIFSYEGDDRRINGAKIIGILFANHSTGSTVGATTQPVDQPFHEVLRFTDGEQISGRWTALAHAVCSLETGGAKQAEFAVSSLASIDFRNGRLTYLSDLTPTKVEQTPFFDQVIPYKSDAALDGGPLRLGNEIYAKGLAVHSRCVLEYELGGKFDRFRTRMGFEPGVGAMGEASVRVSGDGRIMYENDAAKGTDPPVAIDVDVSGVSRLTLEVDFGYGQDVGGRVVWADARVLRAKVGN